MECTIEYFYNPDQESIPVVLEFETLETYSNSDFKIEYPQPISDFSSHGQIRKFAISQDFAGGEVLIANENCDNNTSQIQIDLVPAGIFDILQEILKDGKDLQECMNEVESLYSSSDGISYMNFRADVEKMLDFNQYIQILSMISNHDTRAESIISKNRHPYFKNRLLNPREPHYVSSFEDLTNKINCYNSHELLTDININEALQKTLCELFTRVENSGFDYVSEIIDRIIPRHADEFGYLDKLSICMYVSIFLYSDKSTRATRLFWRWCRHESNQNPSFSDKECISDMDYDSIVDFIFQIAIRNIKTAQYQGTLPIFETVRKTTSVDENPRLHDLAEYYSLIRRGYEHLHANNPSRARENFDEAVGALKSSNNLDSNPNSDKYIRAIDSKCKAVVSEYQDRSDIGSAVTYLSNFIDQELSQIRDTSYLHHRVRGLRSEHIARKHVQDRSLDLAIDQIDEAIQTYRSSDERADEYRSVQLLIQKRTIDAYQSETTGAFQDAAETYDELSNLAQDALEGKNSEKAFEIRSHICSAKHAILNNNLSEAREHIDSITALGPARRENRAIESIINLLEDYEEGHISELAVEPKIVTESTYGMLFDIETNYKLLC